MSSRDAVKRMCERTRLASTPGAAGGQEAGTESPPFGAGLKARVFWSCPSFADPCNQRSARQLRSDSRPRGCCSCAAPRVIRFHQVTTAASCLVRVVEKLDGVGGLVGAEEQEVAELIGAESERLLRLERASRRGWEQQAGAAQQHGVMSGLLQGLIARRRLRHDAALSMPAVAYESLIVCCGWASTFAQEDRGQRGDSESYLEAPGRGLTAQSYWRGPVAGANSHSRVPSLSTKLRPLELCFHVCIAEKVGGETACGNVFLALLTGLQLIDCISAA